MRKSKASLPKKRKGKKGKSLTKASAALDIREKKPDKTLAESESILEFLCIELVYWLTNPDRLLAGHALMNQDAIVESRGIMRPSVLDLKERYLDKRTVIVSEPFEYVTDETKLVKGVKPLSYKVAIREGIPTQIFRRGDFMGDDFSKHSYAHYYTLKLMLQIVEKHFRKFVDIINQALQNRHASDNALVDPIRRASVNLEYVLSILKKQHNGFVGISLPDLFTVDPQSAAITHDLKYFLSAEHGVNDSSTLYTYMFSRETSQAFCQVLADLLTQKLKNLESEIKSEHDLQTDLLEKFNVDNWLKRMPKTNTKERMKLALQILGVRTEENEKEAVLKGWTAGELMFIFRALDNSGVIQRGLQTAKLAVAMEILTGRTHLKFQEKYHLTEKEPFDIYKICEVKDRSGAKRNIKKLANQLKAELDKLIEQINVSE